MGIIDFLWVSMDIPIYKQTSGHSTDDIQGMPGQSDFSPRLRVNLAPKFARCGPLRRWRNEGVAKIWVQQDE